MIAPMRPDKYLRQALVVRRHGANAMSGIGLSAGRAPEGDRPGRRARLDDVGRARPARATPPAVGAAELLGRRATGRSGILCRNHRGLVESLAAGVTRSAPTRCCSTPASPARSCADVLEREHATVVVYDEEFAGLARPGPGAAARLTEVLGLGRGPGARHRRAHARRAHRRAPRPTAAPKPSRPGRTVLLTSGTTGTPKGARRSGGGAPARSRRCSTGSRGGPSETTVVAAPMFHAWGFGQLAISATMTLHRS